jgi:hypothetical protein
MVLCGRSLAQVEAQLLFSRALTRNPSFLADFERMLNLSASVLEDLAETLSVGGGLTRRERTKDLAAKWAIPDDSVTASVSILQFAASRVADEELDRTALHDELSALAAEMPGNIGLAAVEEAILRVTRRDSSLVHEMDAQAALAIGNVLYDSEIDAVFVTSASRFRKGAIGGLAATFHYHEPDGAHKSLTLTMTADAASDIQGLLREALEELSEVQTRGSLPILGKP